MTRLLSIAAGRAPVGVALRCAPERVEDSNAVKLRRMRKAGEVFLGADVAREVVNTIGFSLLVDEAPDAAELVRESVGRLVRLAGRYGSPVVAEGVDVEGAAVSMASAWSPT